MTMMDLVGSKLAQPLLTLTTLIDKPLEPLSNVMAKMMLDPVQAKLEQKDHAEIVRDKEVMRATRTRRMTPACSMGEITEIAPSIRPLSIPRGRPCQWGPTARSQTSLVTWSPS